MILPTLEKERGLWRIGYKFVAGVDEVGFGCCAGPVVAACVLIPLYWEPVANLKDSKKLSPKQRAYIAKEISGECIYGIGYATAKEIDELRIDRAARKAMVRAIINVTSEKANIDFILIDGPINLEIDIPNTGVIKGDSLWQSS